MTQVQKDPAYLKSTEPVYRRESNPLGRFLRDMAASYEDTPWMGVALTTFLASIGVAWVLAGTQFVAVPIIAALIFWWVCHQIDEIQRCHHCPRCEFYIRDDPNYCPSCGYAFNPVLPGPVTVEADAALARPVRIKPEDVTVGADATDTTVRKLHELYQQGELDEAEFEAELEEAIEPEFNGSDQR
jgi:hypothetical protein